MAVLGPRRQHTLRDRRRLPGDRASGDRDFRGTNPPARAQVEDYTEQGRERRSVPTSVIPAEVILMRVGTLPRSSSLRSTDSPLDSIPDRSGSSNASAFSDPAICT